MVNFVAVDDVGRVINPMIVEGQVQGGVAQGIGQALLEAPSTMPAASFCPARIMDYTMPRANNIPNITVATENTMCTHNPLGSKGCGEVGAIGSPPAVINAVVDALKPTACATWTCRRRRENLVDHPCRPAAHGGGITQAEGNSKMYDFAYEKPGSLADAVKTLGADARPRRWPAARLSSRC